MLTRGCIKISARYRNDKFSKFSVFKKRMISFHKAIQ